MCGLGAHCVALLKRYPGYRS
uniref:Uncharacterized protein n=1 Tax=Arundo donax TaxID=35708 RepID=A0A0A8Y9I2_ARUDO